MENEKRLIDANAIHYCFYDLDNYHSFSAVTDEEIAEMPTIDAVEVVRCKDCKHWHEETGWCDHHSWFIEEDGEPCHPWESNNWKMLNDDDFCSYGERKDK